MARTDARLSSVHKAVKSKASESDSAPRSPSPDDSILATGSDEFASGFLDDHEDGESSGATENEDEDDDGTVENHGLGIGVWQPDEWDGGSGDSEEESEEEDAVANDQQEMSRLRRLQNDLTALPFSTLLKAQRSLRHHSPSTSSSHASDSEAGPSKDKDQRVAQIKAKLADMQRGKGKAVGLMAHIEELQLPEEREAREVARIRRESKHAPTAISSKKQVTRMRKVIDVLRPERRDPRFSSVSAGQVDPHLHTKSYNFLPDMLRSELGGLKIAVAAATKAERTCTLVEKPARTAERERLEIELGRLRTKLERTEREARDRAALSGVKRQEREKQKHGKGAWFMKKGEKRELLLKSRFDALQEKGGETAVKKAIEKKRKKVASKEKKSRPFPKGAKGAREGDQRAPAVKRRRVG